MKKENLTKKPKYEAPVALAIGDLPVGSGQEMGYCGNGSSAASGCQSGAFASDMMSWSPNPSCNNGNIAGGDDDTPTNECVSGSIPKIWETP